MTGLDGVRASGLAMAYDRSEGRPRTLCFTPYFRPACAFLPKYVPTRSIWDPRDCDFFAIFTYRSYYLFVTINSMSFFLDTRRHTPKRINVDNTITHGEHIYTGRLIRLIRLTSELTIHDYG